MKTSIVSLCLLFVATLPLMAAETGSSASQADGLPSRALGWGGGHWTRSQSRIEPNFVRGTAIAVDDHEISLSDSSVVGCPAGERIGNTLHITVGPGIGSTSTGHARSVGWPGGVSASGSTNTRFSTAAMQAEGQVFQSQSEAEQFGGLSNVDWLLGQ